MKYLVGLFLILLLVSCNSLSGVNAGLDVVDFAQKVGVDADTNGFYYKHKGPIEHVCEYKVRENVFAFRPC